VIVGENSLFQDVYFDFPTSSQTISKAALILVIYKVGVVADKPQGWPSFSHYLTQFVVLFWGHIIYFLKCKLG